MLFLSLYTPATKPSGPPSPEHMAKMGVLIEKSMREDSLVYSGPLGKSGPGGAKVRLVKGEVTVTRGPFFDSTLMGAAGFALIRATSRKDEGVSGGRGRWTSELLEVLEMPPPSNGAR
jgi:hypothetical protein